MRARTIALLLVLLPQIVTANNKDSGTQNTAEDQPDAELLEFIAEFEPLDGHWIDPIQLNMIFAKNRNGEENE